MKLTASRQRTHQSGMQIGERTFYIFVCTCWGLFTDFPERPTTGLAKPLTPSGLWRQEEVLPRGLGRCLIRGPDVLMLKKKKKTLFK